MELRLLESFLVLSEELHFGRAADRLHLAQSPFSQRIRQLEREVGVPLVERTTRRVDLTPAGRVFAEHARRVLAEADLAAAAARRAHLGQAGRLIVAFSGSLTYALLPLVALGYGQEYPDVDLELRGELLSYEQAEGVRNGDLDVGFLRLPIPETDLHTEVIWREPLVAVLPAQHPLAPAAAISVSDLAESPFVAFPGRRGSALYDAMMRCCESAGFAPRVRREVREAHSLVCFVAAGYGVSLVPASVEHLQTTGVVYRPLIDATETVAMAMITRSQEASPTVKAFVEWVHRHLTKELPRTPATSSTART